MTYREIVAALCVAVCGTAVATFISDLMKVDERVISDPATISKAHARLNRLEAIIDQRNVIQSNREKARLASRQIRDKVEEVKRTVSERDKLLQALYEGLKNAETGSQKNPWIRTKVRHEKGNWPSTAYGPLQLTNTLVQDYYKRKPELFLDPTVQQYIKRLEKQNKLFRKHGYPLNAGAPAGYDSRYDYGGRGDMGETAEDRAAYEQVAQAIIGQLYTERGESVDALIERFRGVPKDQDPDYYSKVYKVLEQQGFKQ